MRALPCENTRMNLSFRELVNFMEEEQARWAVANALIHEVRHWAQAATIVREHGMAPPGDHDLILSHALD